MKLIEKISKISRNSLIKDYANTLFKKFMFIKTNINEFEKEIFLLDSSDETIERYEKFANLEYEESYTLEDRISRVLYTLQAKNTFTRYFLKEQSRIFKIGDIEIEEKFSEFHFIIKFLSIVGQVPNLDNYKKIIELNKPAHLTYELVFRYNTHNDLKKLTHDMMKKYTHKEIFDTRLFED